LAKRSPDDLLSGARVEVDVRKDDPLDFALWKAAKPGEPAWPSPWGPGRPGWHIECSVMSLANLKTDTVDIHGGGQDLIFPHHENEIAQSEGATGKPFARYWIHNGFVTVNKEKMSKSLGNFFTLTDIFKLHAPRVVRFFLLSHHYRGPLEFSDDLLKQAADRLAEIDEDFRRLGAGLKTPLADKPRNAKALEKTLAEFPDRLDEALALGFQQGLGDEGAFVKGVGMRSADQLVKVPAALLVAGVVHSFPEAFKVAKKKGIKLLLGMEAYLIQSADFLKEIREGKKLSKDQLPPYYHCILYARNEKGRRHLYELVSASHTDTFYKRPLIPKALLEAKREGLVQAIGKFGQGFLQRLRVPWFVGQRGFKSRPQPTKILVDFGQSIRGLLEQIVGKFQGAPVVVAQQEKPDDPGRVQFKDVRQGEKISQGFGHFFLVDGHEPVVDPIPGERLARGSLGLGDFVFVVGENQILPAPVDIDGVGL
jgi:hypothetical protein